MNIVWEDPALKIREKAEDVQCLLTEALENFQENSLQESLEKMIVVSTRAREIIGIIKEENARQEEPDIVTAQDYSLQGEADQNNSAGIKAGKCEKKGKTVKHVMWYELNEKYLPEEYRHENPEKALPGRPAAGKQSEFVSGQPVPVEELELSVRSENCLRRAGIGTIEELVQKTPGELKQIRNFGRKCLEEVAGKLAEKHLSLREDADRTENTGKPVPFS